MTEQKGKWGKDKFTQMVKEYGDKIAGISDRVEKELKDMLENEKEIKMFQEYSGKKKLNNSVEGSEVLNIKSTFKPIFSYDLGMTTSITETDDIDGLDNGMMEADDVFPEDIESDIFDIDELTKFEIEGVKKIAESTWKKFAKLTGKNISYFAWNYLKYGPGLMRYNIFDGVVTLFKTSMNENTADKIYKIYETNDQFRKAYSKIMSRISKNSDSIHSQLIRLANNAKKLGTRDSCNEVDLDLYRAIINVITILGNKLFYPIISKEITGNVAGGNVITEHLKSYINSVLEMAQKTKVNEEKNDKVITFSAELYLERFEKSNIRPISVLLFLVSNAIAIGMMKNKFGSPIEKEKVAENNTIKYRDFIKTIDFKLEDFIQMKDKYKTDFDIVNLNNIIFKSNKIKYRIDYKKFIDTLYQTKSMELNQLLKNWNITFTRDVDVQTNLPIETRNRLKLETIILDIDKSNLSNLKKILIIGKETM